MINLQIILFVEIYQCKNGQIRFQKFTYNLSSFDSIVHIMDIWPPIIIGSVMFLYIQSFNRIARMYFQSGKTLEWRDFFTVVLPLSNV